MSKLKPLRLALVFFAITISALGAFGRIPGLGFFKAQNVRLGLTTQLPLGCNKSQVLTFLDAHGIEHSGQNKAPADGLIYAIIRQTNWGFLCEVDTQITFSFDSKGTLMNYTIHEIATGP